MKTAGEKGSQGGGAKPIEFLEHSLGGCSDKCQGPRKRKEMSN